MILSRLLIEIALRIYSIGGIVQEVYKYMSFIKVFIYKRFCQSIRTYGLFFLYLYIINKVRDMIYKYKKGNIEASKVKHGWMVNDLNDTFTEQDNELEKVIGETFPDNYSNTNRSRLVFIQDDGTCGVEEVEGLYNKTRVPKKGIQARRSGYVHNCFFF